jgi:hypothetical protein
MSTAPHGGGVGAVSTVSNLYCVSLEHRGRNLSRTQNKLIQKTIFEDSLFPTFVFSLGSRQFVTEETI